MQRTVQNGKETHVKQNGGIELDARKKANSLLFEMGMTDSGVRGGIDFFRSMAHEDRTDRTRSLEEVTKVDLSPEWRAEALKLESYLRADGEKWNFITR